MLNIYIFSKSGEFKRIGILVRMSFLNGGSGYPYFAPAIYSYISGQDVCDIVTTVEEVPNDELKAVLLLCFHNGCMHRYIFFCVTVQTVR